MEIDCIGVDSDGNLLRKWTISDLNSLVNKYKTNKTGIICSSWHRFVNIDNDFKVFTNKQNTEKIEWR